MRVLFALLFLVSTVSHGQEKDAMLWTGAGVKAKVAKGLYLSYQMQTRFYKNASTLSQYYNAAGIKYVPMKGLSIGLKYRYSRKNQESYFQGVNRISMTLAYSYKLDPVPLRIKTRLKYQNSFVPNQSSKNMLRAKFDLKYKNDDFKRVQPFVSYEFYTAIGPKNIYSSFIDTYRFSFGIDFDLPHRNELSVFYIFEHENRSTINQNHIYGLVYTYSIGNIAKGKDKH